MYHSLSSVPNNAKSHVMYTYLKNPFLSYIVSSNAVIDNTGAFTKGGEDDRNTVPHYVMQYP